MVKPRTLTTIMLKHEEEKAGGASGASGGDSEPREAPRTVTVAPRSQEAALILVRVFTVLASG